MIKFFRKIRQRLLSENKFSKYLLYAIGEIILVVIGILIALQINNWNIEQKEEQFELELLSEFRVNLENTIDDINANIEYHQRAINSAEIILSAFEMENVQSDTLESHYAKVALIPQFLINKTAYEKLKLNGTGLIKNDTLRNEIIEIYDDHSVFMLKLIDSEWNSWMADYRTLYRKHFAKSHYTKEMTPVNYQELRTNEEYRNYLHNRIGALETIIGLYKGNLIRSKKLIDNISKELNERVNE